jgi:hypothetical protein
MSGLADYMLEDLSIRKKIVDHKPPHERKEKTDAMARELQSAFSKVDKDSIFAIEKAPLIQACVLHPPEVHMGKGKTSSFSPSNGEFPRLQAQCIDTYNFKNWVLILD